MTEVNPYRQAVALVVERTGLRPLPAEAVDQLARELWDRLHYLSTACAHALFDDEAVVRAPCRSTCKWCGRTCKGPDHPLPDDADTQPHPVDQARDVARELYAAVLACGAEQLLGGLQRRVVTDPALFWLRGEEKAPVTWRPEDGTDAT